MPQSEKVVVTEAVGVFDGYEDLQDTIKDLNTHGFGRHQISVRGSEGALKYEFGTDSVAPEYLEDNPSAPRSHLVGVEELGVAQGVLVGAGLYLGAAIAIITTDGLASSDAILTLVTNSVLGGLVGGLLARFLSTQYYKFFQNQERMGGLVLWVETPDEEQRETAESILRKHGGRDVHTHNMAIAA